MIFRPELAKLILQGKKSQTRRRAETTTCRYEAGKAYAVQPGRGKTSVCRITIQDVRRERLGDITLKDAKKEGFVTTDEFFTYWEGLHGSVNEDLPVWVISFHVGDSTDAPRFLAARPGPPSGDYVTNPLFAMPGELEAVDQATQEKLTKMGTVRWSQEHAFREAQRMRLHLHERLQALERQSQRKDGPDVSGELRVIRDRLKKLREAA